MLDPTFDANREVMKINRDFGWFGQDPLKNAGGGLITDSPEIHIEFLALRLAHYCAAGAT